MKTYIINLEKSIDRRRHMHEQLEKYPFLDAEYVTAVDGREMTEEERAKRFDLKSFQARYGKNVRPGEIGCTLSHQKCYRILAQGEKVCALILEDDIVVNENIREIMKELETWMDSAEPRIVLLSGWYWFLKTGAFHQNYRLADVYDGFLTHSYVINQSAARLLIEEKPGITADDWKYIRRKGIDLKALRPHLIDQDWSGEYQTLVNTAYKSQSPLPMRVRFRILVRVVVLRLLKIAGHFEKPKQ